MKNKGCYKNLRSSETIATIKVNKPTIGRVIKKKEGYVFIKKK